MAYFGYVVDGEDEFFNTKEEMLENFENLVKDLGKSWDFTEEEVLEMTQFSIVFNSKEEFENFLDIANK